MKMQRGHACRRSYGRQHVDAQPDHRIAMRPDVGPNRAAAAGPQPREASGGTARMASGDEHQVAWEAAAVMKGANPACEDPPPSHQPTEPLGTLRYSDA